MIWKNWVESSITALEIWGDGKNIALVTNFDFTLSKKYNYQKNLSLGSSYGFYDESLIGGNQQKVLEIQNDLFNKYMKYETDSSIDIKRKKRMRSFI